MKRAQQMQDRTFNQTSEVKRVRDRKLPGQMDIVRRGHNEGNAILRLRNLRLLETPKKVQQIQDYA